MKKLKIILINSLMAFSFVFPFAPAFLILEKGHFLSFSSYHGKNYLVLEHLGAHTGHEHGHKHKIQSPSGVHDLGINAEHFKDSGDHVIELPDFDFFITQLNRLDNLVSDFQINQENFINFISLLEQVRDLPEYHLKNLTNSQLLQLNTVRLLF